MPLYDITYWPLRDLNEIYDKQLSNLFKRQKVEVSLAKLLSDECHWTSLMISQRWFR